MRPAADAGQEECVLCVGGVRIQVFAKGGVRRLPSNSRGTRRDRVSAWETVMKTTQIEGFTTNIRQTVDLSLVIGLFGPQGSGKTRFCSTAPDPIGVVPLDRKSRYTFAKTMEEYGKIVMMPKEDFIRHENPIKLAAM